MIRIRRALLSGWAKKPMLELASALAGRGVEFFATRGTATALEEAGHAVTRLESWLGFPEILGGRVKTLHPKLHAALLAPRDPAGLAELASIGSVPIDLVAVDLYPFEEAVRERPGDAAHGVEHIDIGGVTLLRAAAKNCAYVTVLPDAASRAEFLPLLPSAAGDAPLIPPDRARRWAARAFGLTSAYDAAIAGWLESSAAPASAASRLPASGIADAASARVATAAAVPRDAAAEPETALPASLRIEAGRELALRYGENPHQQAAWYRTAASLPFERLHEGREISWNNLLDVEAATALAAQLDPPAAVVVKHTNPCGAALGRTPEEALARAWEGDSLSAFGGIVALRGTMTEAAARHLSSVFVEVVAAEDFEPEALALLGAKKGLRILRGAMRPAEEASLRLRSLLGGIGAQRGSSYRHGEWSLATRRAPTPEELLDLELAWRVAAAAQSNSIALVKDGRLIGLGSGQTSRVDAVHVALYRARRAGHDPAGSSLASDGFFPFRDNVDLAAQGGVTAVVQPGGSRRDPEVLAAAEEHRLAMMWSGARCFRH